MEDSAASWGDEKSSLRRSSWTRERKNTEKKPSRPDSDRTVRELTKRLKSIYEDEDVEFGTEEHDSCTIIDRFEVATKLRKKRIAEVMRNVRRSRNVELCFLVDATGSMQPHIDGVRKSINDVVSKLTDSAPHVSFALRNGAPEVQELSLAFVAYRDHSDRNQFEVLEFTKSTEVFQSFCSRIVASGGGDGPEDVFGGLENALNLNWSANAATKVIFHICDAPCHGSEFHNLKDDYPSGDPKGRSHTTLFSTLRSKGIQYHFGKINNYTDTMIRKFSEAYGEAIVDFDIKMVDDIRESVITAVSVSVSTSISTSMSSVGAKRELKTYTYVKEEPNWDSCPLQKGKFLSYEFPESIRDIKDDIPLVRCSPKSANLKIASNPFSKGAERVAFFGLDLSSFVSQDKTDSSEKKIEHRHDKIVLKEYLHKGKGMNSAKRYELSNQIQTIAAYLANKFGREVQKKLNLKKTIKFLKIKTLQLTGSPLRIMSCERRFAKTDNFVRFTNNTDYNLLEEKAAKLGVSSDFLQLVMAFSHWTFKESDRFLMVVDLEGIISKIGSGETAVLLTDPAIHCIDLTRYGPMNHGKEGMKNFFSRHVCNEYCKRLGISKFGLTG